MADRTFLDWPFFGDAHRVFVKALSSWIESQPDDDHSDVDAACRNWVKQLGAGGWLKHCVPSNYGGVNDQFDVRTLCLTRETLAYQSALADFSFAMQGLGSGSITLAGSDELKQKYLPDVAAGSKIAAFALTEPDAGSDVAAISTTAELDGDHYTLNGTKTWISNGGIADYYVVFARTGEAPGAKGLSAFVVDADTPGLTIAERLDVIAPHPLATLKFENCRVPISNLLGKSGGGFKIAMATLDIFRPTVGAAALGFARRALDEALKRTTTRMISGQPLSGYQMTEASLAEMALDIDASALLIYRAAWTKDQGAARITREAAMAKLFATEAAQQIIDKAVQLFGALGVQSGHPVENLYREIRALRIYEGASEVQKVIIARQVLEKFGNS